MHRHGYKQLNRDSYLSLSPSRPNKPEPPLRINRSGRMLQILVLVFRKKFQSWVFEGRKRVEIWFWGKQKGREDFRSCGRGGPMAVWVTERKLIVKRGRVWF